MRAHFPKKINYSRSKRNRDRKVEVDEQEKERRSKSHKAEGKSTFNRSEYEANKSTNKTFMADELLGSRCVPQLRPTIETALGSSDMTKTGVLYF